MALLAQQRIVAGGLTPTYAAAAGGGDTLIPGDDVFLHVKTGATGATVTVNSQRLCDQGVDHDLVVVIGTTSERMIGPLNPTRFADPADGLVKVTYSQVATVTVAAVAI
jgi:hypothetical protein